MTSRRAAIACVYCGGAHDTGAEVRQCWERSGGKEVVAPAEPELFPPEPADDDHPEPDFLPRRSNDPPAHAPAHRPADAPAAPVARRASPLVAPDGPIRRGPRQLGRHVIVEPGAAVPPEWADAPHIPLGDGSPAAHAALLSHTLARTGCVIETALDLDALAAEHTFLAPHELGARFTFTAEAVAHLALSNAVDVRAGTHRWATLEMALGLGARPVHDGRGDVELPDGARVWLDGGPPRWSAPLDGLPVLHRVVVEHGGLRPPEANVTPADLAADQLAAVTHEGGAARIIAPAGSGKTRVLTERARHLVTRWHVPPSAIALVAFNKRAQEEMQARTADVRGLQVRTLNAIALAVVNGSAPFAPQPQRLATIDEPAVRRMVQQLVKFPRKRNSDPASTWIEALSLARLGLLSPEQVEARYDGEVEGFAAVFPQYRRALARAGEVDYDEQVQRAIEVLLTQPDARHRAHRACRWMLVDEFQDLTPAHLLLVRLLAGPDGAVFAVGDDDQTIYGYNGADPAWLIDFADLFPGSGDHPLEVNYRCPAGVVRAADTLLRHNRRRVRKTIRAADTEHDGFLVAPADGDSVATTVRAVTTALAAGASPSDVAVLTRVNSLLAPVQVALAERGRGHHRRRRPGVRRAHGGPRAWRGCGWPHAESGSNPPTWRKPSAARLAPSTLALRTGWASKLRWPPCAAWPSASPQSAMPPRWRPSPPTSSGCSGSPPPRAPLLPCWSPCATRWVWLAASPPWTPTARG